MKNAFFFLNNDFHKFLSISFSGKQINHRTLEYYPLHVLLIRQRQFLHCICFLFLQINIYGCSYDAGLCPQHHAAFELPLDSSKMNPTLEIELKKEKRKIQVTCKTDCLMSLKSLIFSHLLNCISLKFLISHLDLVTNHIKSKSPSHSQ